MTWHLIEGEAGCTFARENHCVALVVDALRASATAAMLLHHGATELYVVREVADALRAKEAWPDALLYGERGGFPPEGFDHGNSPNETEAAAERRVIFTTTTGSTRLLDSFGAAAVYMASPVNALAAIMTAASHDEDVVLIPAGRAGDPEFDADEDWAGAAFIATCSGQEIGEGALWFREWRQRLELDGIEGCFRQAPHGKKLLELGFEADLITCAKPNITQTLPHVVESLELGLRVQNIHNG